MCDTSARSIGTLAPSFNYIIKISCSIISGIGRSCASGRKLGEIVSCLRTLAVAGKVIIHTVAITVSAAHDCAPAAPYVYHQYFSSQEACPRSSTVSLHTMFVI